MEITKEIKDRVIKALNSEHDKRGISWAEFAKVIRLRHNIKFDKTVFPQINRPGNRCNYAAVKDTTWMVLAKYYNVITGEEEQWHTAETYTYVTVHTHLELCKEYGVWQVLCDRAGIGKSYAAQEFARDNKNVFYIDCSQCPTQTDFISRMASHFGIERKGSFIQQWNEATDELILMDKPLLILDEFGDCRDGIITLMKSLYNKANMGSHMALGCYFIGADNLKEKLISGRTCKKQSYAEFWSRFNGRITNLGYSSSESNFIEELKKDTEAIVDANLTDKLKNERESIINKSLRTKGVRSIQGEFSIKRKIYNEQAE